MSDTVVRPDAARPPSPSSVRLTVVGDGRRLEVAAPSGVPVVDLVPGFARRLGRLDAGTVWAGHRLVRADGSAVDADRDLPAQGIGDGTVLVLEAGADLVAPTVHDDVVEAVADVVAARLRPWTSRDAARSAVATAIGLLLTAALGLVAMPHGGSFLTLLTVGVVVLLLGAAAVFDRVRDDHAAAVALALTATVFGAVAGLRAADGAVIGRPLALAGLGLVVVAGLAAPVLSRRRGLVAGPCGLGVVLLVTGGLVGVVHLPAERVAPFAVAAVAAAVVVVRPGRTARRSTRRADSSSVGLLVAAGLTVAAMVPALVTTGVAGTTLTVLAGGSILLRARAGRTTAHASPGRLVGVVELAVAVALLPLAVATAGLVGLVRT